MRIKNRVKKGIAVLLSSVLTFGMAAGIMPGSTLRAQAASVSISEPSITFYATKDQLMDGTFAPNADGTADNVGKLAFGKNSSGEVQEWYILGKDNGVAGDNTAIFAAEPIATDVIFNSRTTDKPYIYENEQKTVYANHYGASALRNTLQDIARNTGYFSMKEQSLMQETEVKTMDTYNNNVYATSDKLYALGGDSSQSVKIWAGSNDDKCLDLKTYFNSGKIIWLRTPLKNEAGSSTKHAYAYIAASGSGYGQRVYGTLITVGNDIRPASNLDLSKVLFASGADMTGKTMTNDMILRLDGSEKNIGSVTYNASTGKIKAVKGNTANKVLLVVQYKYDGKERAWFEDEFNDSKLEVTISDIKKTAKISDSVGFDLSKCKIWLEMTDSDGMVYAVEATKVTEDPGSEIGSEHSHCICGRENAEEGGESHSHTAQSWTGISSLDEIKKAGYYYLKNDIVLTDTWKMNVENGVFLCLNGCSIIGANGKSVITNYKQLTITDCHSGSETGKITHNTGEIGRGIENESGADFVLYNGCITGNTAVDENGGGVRNDHATFSMLGGSITNNVATKKDYYSGHGGGVYNESNSTFKMAGSAVISNNTAEDGGGVYNYYHVDMYGHSAIRDNVAGTGGGVWNGGSSKTARFTMHDESTINGNIATTAAGGGVFTCDGYFGIEKKASITGNHASQSVGGGVFHSGTSFEMNGGSITGNTASSSYGGGGIWVNSANPVKLAGKVTITGNTAKGDRAANYYQMSSHIIEANGLTEGSMIGIAHETFPRTEPTVLTNEGCNPAYFSSDSSSCSIVQSGSAVALMCVQAPKIETQPQNASVNKGETATFTVNATGTGLTYQWQIKRNDGNGFMNIDGATSASYTTGVTDQDCNRFRYRCVVRNSAGSVTTEEVMLTVQAVTEEKDKLVSIMAPTAITVANGTLYENMNLPNLVNIETIAHTVAQAAVSWDTASPISGSYDPAITTEQTVTLKGSVTCPEDIDANGVDLSTSITITISAAGITGAPIASVESGTYTENRTVELKSSTEGATIYYTTDGSDPGVETGIVYTTPISVTGTEGQSVTTTIKAIAVKDGMQNSEAKTFTYTIEIPEIIVPPSVEKPMITSQPQNVSVKVGEQAAFAVTASGEGMTYQWQIDRNDGNGFVDITGANSANYLSSTVDKDCNGFKYQCVISNAGGSVTTEIVTLTVTENTTPQPTPEPTPEPAPKPTTVPAQYKIIDGANSQWTQNTDGSLVIRGDGEMAKFQNVKVDGVIVDAKNYTVTEGSTIITFTSDYLKTLSAGSHTFEMFWTDGSASTNFAVVKNTTVESPKETIDNNSNISNNNAKTNVTDAKNDNQNVTATQTGDPMNLTLWMVILMVSLAGCTGMIVRRKKHYK